MLLIKINNVNIYKTSHIIMIFRNDLSMQCFSIERNFANVRMLTWKYLRNYNKSILNCMSIDIELLHEDIYKIFG